MVPFGILIYFDITEFAVTQINYASPFNWSYYSVKQLIFLILIYSFPLTHIFLRLWFDPDFSLLVPD